MGSAPSFVARIKSRRRRNLTVVDEEAALQAHNGNNNHSHPFGGSSNASRNNDNNQRVRRFSGNNQGTGIGIGRRRGRHQQQQRIDRGNSWRKSDLRIVTTPQKHPKPSDTDMKGIDYTPMGDDKNVFKFFCPLCFRNFKCGILSTECCNNYVCYGCATGFLEGKYGLPDKLEQVPVKLPAKMPCCHCNTIGLSLKYVSSNATPRNYTDSPETQRLLEEAERAKEMELLGEEKGPSKDLSSHKTPAQPAGRCVRSTCLTIEKDDHGHRRRLDFTDEIDREALAEAVSAVVSSLVEPFVGLESAESPDGPEVNSSFEAEESSDSPVSVPATVPATALSSPTRNQHAENFLAPGVQTPQHPFRPMEQMSTSSRPPLIPNHELGTLVENQELTLPSSVAMGQEGERPSSREAWPLAPQQQLLVAVSTY